MYVPDRSEENEYSTIDNDYITPYADHHYEDLQCPKDHKVQPLQIETPAREGKKTCKKPPCWGWVVIIIGIGVILALGAVVAVLLVTNKTGADNGHPDIQSGGPNGGQDTGNTNGPSTSVTDTPSSKSPPVSGQCLADVAILLNNYWPNSEDWFKLLDFVTNVVRLLPIGNQATRLSLVTTSTSIQLIHRFADEQNRNEIEVKIWKLGYSVTGFFHGDDEFSFVRRMVFNQTAGDRDNRANVLLVIMSKSPFLGLRQSVRREVLQMHHIATVIPIALSDDVDEETLSLFASNPQSSFRVQNYSMLTGISGNVVNTVCEGTK